MLIISRGVAESLVIQNHIRIHILEIRGDNVRLGIESPSEISLHRKELLAAHHPLGDSALKIVPNYADEAAKS